MRTGNSFAEQREAELQSWLDHKVFDVVKKKVADKDRVMRARWVLTWKSTGKAKARLRVLGFQDPDLTEVPPDSPTLSAQAEALILQCGSSNKWMLVSGDIMTAFLSGDGEYRNIFTLPPDDVRDILKLSPESMLSLRKAVYGLVNAPKKWWDRLKRSLQNHGFSSCALDPCAFVTGHVDDLLGGGDEVFDRTMLEVKRKFHFGAWDVGAMMFRARQLTQMANHEIMIDKDHQVHARAATDRSLEVRQKPHLKGCLTAKEVTSYRGGRGGIRWLIVAVHNFPSTKEALATE